MEFKAAFVGFCLFAAVSRAAVLENVKQEAEEFLRELVALDANDQNERGASWITDPTPKCTLPTVEYGSFICRDAVSGSPRNEPSIGDLCQMTCDAGLYPVETIRPLTQCKYNFATNEAYIEPMPSCKKYDVMLLKSPEGNNKLNYAEAKALCEANGARLATQRELHNAMEEGFELCSCGILEDSLVTLGSDTYLVASYAMQPGTPGCQEGNTYPMNVCMGMADPNVKYNAWCHAD